MKLNIDELQQSCGNDIEFVCDLMNTMIKDGQTRISAIQQACQQQDWQCVGRHAHALKGAALNLGASDLSAACAKIDDAMRWQDTAPQRADINVLIAEFDQLVVELKQTVERLSR